VTCPPYVTVSILSIDCARPRTLERHTTPHLPITQHPHSAYQCNLHALCG